MNLKFLGSLASLKRALKPLALKGEWQKKPHGVWIFRQRDGAGMHWSESKGTLWFSGKSDADTAKLKRRVRSAISVSSTSAESKAKRSRADFGGMIRSGAIPTMAIVIVLTAEDLRAITRATTAEG